MVPNKGRQRIFWKQKKTLATQEKPSSIFCSPISSIYINNTFCTAYAIILFEYNRLEDTIAQLAGVAYILSWLLEHSRLLASLGYRIYLSWRAFSTSSIPSETIPLAAYIALCALFARFAENRALCASLQNSVESISRRTLHKKK